MATRRRVLQSAVGGVVGLALGSPPWRGSTAQAQPPAGAIRREALGGNLHVLTVDGVNVVVRASADDTLLVDGGPAAFADALLAAVSALPGGGRIQTLFNTHWHPEQTGLNERLGSAGAAIIAQENTRLWLTTDITYPWDGRTFEPLPEVARPNRTFYDEDLLGPDFRCGYLRHAAHTDGDLYVHFLEPNVLAVGDAITGAGWPFVDWWTGGWIGGIVGGLELMLALADSATRIVPARGPVMSRVDLESQYDMYSTIYERLSRLLNSGRGPDEAVAARPTEQFDAAMGPSDEFVRMAFQSLWAYLSPDASNARPRLGKFV